LLAPVAVLEQQFCEQPPEPWCCCDRKARAARAQSFALWQQATIKITRRDHSVVA